MASEDSVQANLSQDDSQPGLSGLNITATMLGSQPSASMESQLLSQGTNRTIYACAGTKPTLRLKIHETLKH